MYFNYLVDVEELVIAIISIVLKRARLLKLCHITPPSNSKPSNFRELLHFRKLQGSSYTPAILLWSRFMRRMVRLLSPPFLREPLSGVWRPSNPTYRGGGADT